MKKFKLFLPVLALVLGGILLYSSTKVSAFGMRGDQNSFIQALADKLGLSEDRVQTAFDEIRADHQAQMLQAFTDRLDEAVASGEITPEQKQLILEKHEELRAQHEAEMQNRDQLTREEWRQLRQSHHEEMEAWAEENGIDLESFFGNFGSKAGFMGHPGRGMHGGFAGEFTN